MDASRLGTGERIAAISAAVLLIDMFLLDWFGAPSVDTPFGGVDLNIGVNAWEAFGFIDIVLFVTAVAAISVAVMAANASDANLPVAGSAIVAGLGILSTILILYRVIDPVGEADRELGLFIGLLAAAGIAYGGWRAMEEEGASFGDRTDRLGGDGGRGGGAAPPTG